MCGICGGMSLAGRPPVSQEHLGRMLERLRHRGPDDSGFYRDERVGLAHARLSIIDLEGGRQPIANEDESVWVVLNGEIFNYPELRAELIKRGHRFRTRTDTEVLVHGYEEKGEEFVRDLNGQFAFALWDRKRRRLLLVRDRFGIAPLFYVRAGGSLLFASEIKALLAHPEVKAEPDPFGLDQLFTFWATLPPRTTFKNILELPPAHRLTVSDGGERLQPYWDLDFPDREEARGDGRGEKVLREAFMELLLDSVRIRLRADVPVASFLSGGLDSSIISALVRRHFNPELRTFSVRFADRDFDEGRHQKAMTDHLGTEHREVLCRRNDIGRIMPAVVRHAEKPLIRTAPAPLYLLAREVRRAGIKVVLTGEGADEILGGYDLFREMKIRRFWARRPESKFRPLLLQRLYPYLPDWPRRAPRVLEAFYRSGLARTEHPGYSHFPRWETTAWIKRFYAETWREQLRGYDAVEEYAAALPPRFAAWEPLAQAQYIEIKTLLAGNLLSSQGDRMVMAHGVESRQPFLDHRLAEFCAALPPGLKLKGLNEKYLLKKAAAPYLPPGITERRKQAYRAPDGASFFGEDPPEYLGALLTEANLRRTGYFSPAEAGRLVRKCRNSAVPSGARENLAAVGIITTLLSDSLFIHGDRLLFPGADAEGTAAPAKEDETSHGRMLEMRPS